MIGKDNLLLNYNPQNGKYLALNWTTHGANSPAKFNAAMITARLKNKIQFVDWTPTGYRCGMMHAVPT